MTEQQQSDTDSNSIIPFQINSWEDSLSSSTGEHELQVLSPATPTQSSFDEISSPNDFQEQQQQQQALSPYSTISDTPSSLDDHSTEQQQVSPSSESSTTTTTFTTTSSSTDTTITTTTITDTPTPTTSSCSNDDSQVITHEKSISEKLACVERFKSKFGRGSGNDISLVTIGILMDKLMDLCYATFLKDGHLTDRLLRSNLQYYKVNCLYFNEMSHGPFLFFENLQNEYMAALLLPGYDHIETSLPPSLRYLHAACLPLGPKTRMAHVLWSIHYFKFITLPFLHYFCCIYHLLAGNADQRYQGIDRVIKPLIKIESKIILNHEEIKVLYPFHHHQC